MKSLFFAAALSLVGPAAFADGFVCTTTQGDLNLKVYNHVHAQLGTRTAAVMVISDPNAAPGQKTIARFKDGEEALVSHSATYTATLAPSASADRLVAGIQLGYVKTITLDVYYNFNAPAPAGAKIDGELTLDTAKGPIIRQVECTRYLKNGN